MLGFLNKRPASLSIQIASNPANPAIIRAVVNGGVIGESLIRGRRQTGGLGYQSAFGAKISVELAWFDLIDEQAYSKHFDLDANDLSTFGEEASHASLRIETGPGADITVTTPHPEGLRLVGLNQMDKITAEMDIPIELLLLCGDEISNSTQTVQDLRLAEADTGGIASAMENRANWLNQNTAPISRCRDG